MARARVRADEEAVWLIHDLTKQKQTTEDDLGKIKRYFLLQKYKKKNQKKSETFESPSSFNRSCKSPAAECLFVCLWKVFLSAASILLLLSAVSLRVIRSGTRVHQGSLDSAGNEQNDRTEDRLTHRRSVEVLPCCETWSGNWKVDEGKGRFWDENCIYHIITKGKKYHASAILVVIHLQGTWTMHIESRDLISVLRKYISKQNTTIIIFNDEFSQYITLFSSILYIFLLVYCYFWLISVFSDWPETYLGSTSLSVWWCAICTT